MRALALLPFRAGIAVGTLLGRAAHRFATRRRRVAAVNIALCFPQLNPAQQRQLVRETFIATGIGLVEIAWSWWGAPKGIQCTVVGSELFAAAQAKGRGVLLLGAHFSTMDFGGYQLRQHIGAFAALQRPHASAAMQGLIDRGRARFCHPIERNDFRAVKRILNANGTVWYAPDQDFGLRNSVFVPFFGHPAATLTMTTRLAAMSGAATLFVRHQRERDGYILEFIALDNFPGPDAAADAAQYNRVLEHAIRRHPEQYLWLHKRFKTQPDGNQKLYRAAGC